MILKYYLYATLNAAYVPIYRIFMTFNGFLNINKHN